MRGRVIIGAPFFSSLLVIMPNVLMTGCFGNVGSNAVRYLMTLNQTLQRDDNPARVKLTCFEKDSPAAKANWQELVHEFGENAFVTIWGDLLNEAQVKEAVKGQDAIIHLAAIIPPLAYKIPDVARKVNVDATKLLLDAGASQPKPPRFVYASSYSVQGNKNPNKSNPLMNGDTPLNPQDSYAGHKAKCEVLVKQYPGEWTICRIGAVTVTAKAVLSGSSGGASTSEANSMLFGIPANQHRHGVHSADAGRAFGECAITKNPVAGKILSIGGDSSWKVTSAAFGNVIFRSLGIGNLPTEVFRNPSPDNDAAFYYEEWMDTTESQALLDFQKHTIQDWENEMRQGVGMLRRSLVTMVSPLARFFFARTSPHYRYNTGGGKDPLAEKSMIEIMGALKAE